MPPSKAIPVYPSGKIDVHKRVERYRRFLEAFRKDDSIIPENKQLILSFLYDCELGKTITGRSKRRISPGRCHKYLTVLKRLSETFGKSFGEVAMEDMERFVLDLEHDRFLRFDGKLLKPESKVDFKRAIKKFWKWKDGGGKSYPPLVEWIETYVPAAEIPALRRAEVEAMIEHTASARDKALVMVLFDSGARAEEILNVRLKPEHVAYSEELKCYKMRIEFSKTKARTITLPLSTKYLRAWLRVHPGKEIPDAQLFPLTYGNLRMLVHRLGKRALGKSASPHLLRHSSATFYANKLRNRFQMCYRYGWTMSSKQVDRYIDREGLFEHETAETVKSDEIGLAQKQSRELGEELALLREAHSKLRAELDSLRSGKGLLTLLASILARGGSEVAVASSLPKAVKVLVERAEADQREVKRIVGHSGGADGDMGPVPHKGME